MKAEMQHTAETIRKLARVQYDTYFLAQKLFVFLLGAVLVWLGAAGGFDGTTSVVLIAIGCWMVTSINASADRNAKKMIEYAKGDFPRSEYTFLDSHINISGDGQQTKLEYKDIYSLISDGVYLYLFISKFSAYMVPLESLEQKNRQQLKTMLEEKTGKRFEKPGSLLTISFKSLMRSFKK